MMHRFLTATALTVTLLSTGAGFAQSADADGGALSEEARIKALVEQAIDENPALVLNAILENPEVVMKAITILRQREEEAAALSAQAAMATVQGTLMEGKNAPIVGNPDGTLSMVEFFDYNCSFCKKAMPIMQALIEENPDLRVVYREWPILGDGSVFAARAALASRAQGKYEEFHWAMMGQKGQATEASVLKIARDIGLDIAKLREDMNSPEVNEHISTSMRIAATLNINGTPSFVIGGEVVPGFVPQDQMQAFLDAARQDAEAGEDDKG